MTLEHRYVQNLYVDVFEPYVPTAQYAFTLGRSNNDAADHDSPLREVREG